mmetsp:Transcript_7991/g.23578  ORF Transcript_7991/g.23578 Transcript_7991/m.23578 type:complete len:209 (+) Transcript_7991:1240-1866(+)
MEATPTETLNVVEERQEEGLIGIQAAVHGHLGCRWRKGMMPCLFISIQCHLQHFVCLGVLAHRPLQIKQGEQRISVVRSLLQQGGYLIYVVAPLCIKVNLLHSFVVARVNVRVFRIAIGTRVNFHRQTPAEGGPVRLGRHKNTSLQWHTASPTHSTPCTPPYPLARFLSQDTGAEDALHFVIHLEPLGVHCQHRSPLRCCTLASLARG